MAGILDNSGGIWSFHQKVALLEQALNQEKSELRALSDEAEYQISTVTAGLNQVVSDSTRDNSERRRAQYLLDGLSQSLTGYRNAREEVFRLIGADPTADNSQSAQAFLARLGQTLDEYYGLDSSSSGQTTVNEYVEAGTISDVNDSIVEQADSISDSPKTLTPDRDAWLRRGVAAVQQRVEAYKDDLRVKGYSESEVKSMGEAEYGRIMHDEFGPDFNHWGESF